MLNINSSVAVLTASLILSACGSDNHQSKENNSTSSTPFTTEFKSNLTLQKDSDPIIQISGRRSNQNDDVNAYSVTHRFYRGSSSIILIYNFDKSDINKTLHINYDPILKKVLSVSIGKTYLTKLNINSSNNNSLACSDSILFEACKNINVKFDEKTGNSEINFENLKLSNTPTITITPVNTLDSVQLPPINKSYTYLTGKISGSLSIPAQTFENIRKTSQINMSVNQKSISPIDAIYDPETKEILFSSYADNWIDSGLKPTNFTTSIENTITKYALVEAETLHGFSGACMSFVVSTRIKDVASIQASDNTNDISLKFNQSIYQDNTIPPLFPNIPIQQTCATTFIQLDGVVKVNKPLTQLQITPTFKNGENRTVVQPALYFDVINHNQQRFGNNTIQIELKNNKIEKINFKDFLIGVDSSTGLLKRFEYNFTCDAAQSCQGISYSPKDNQLKFSNTALFYKGEHPELNKNIHINGIFDFAGR
ncbi:hypothetical protein [Acinetobacter tjernbergiae]|uniref:Uncharacterized protein n=1 Tax=Acinetobacter tjernbergiae DSM 14971 = CIP 107465 TaxID=1120928 RepID=V2V074_9GAMM|nr:hypothetical protein [Acinetobacter tjernbergiae]ESK54290.1 hypothetical protein F990_02840 [Acinetobacter tjernbergiae DSM 14971 = CIP 107465]